MGLITLNRPKALNALNSQLVGELNAAAAAFDKDDGVGAIVITGSDRAFAAGADIKQMAKTEFPQVYSSNMFAEWADLTRITKPVSVPGRVQRPRLRSSPSPSTLRLRPRCATCRGTALVR